MNDTVLLVCIGFIIGVIASSAVWLVLFVVGKAQRQIAREKNLVMKAVAEESAEADKVLSSSVSKAMNAHALRSALSPRIDKMQKTITENMHQLDTFFVKYMESRIAAYRAAFEAGEIAPAAYVADRIPPAAQPLQAESPAGILDEIRTRMESSGPAVAQPTPRAVVLPRGRPAADPGTGVITVSGDVREERPWLRRRRGRRELSDPKCGGLQWSRPLIWKRQRAERSRGWFPRRPRPRRMQVRFSPTGSRKRSGGTGTSSWERPPLPARPLWWKAPSLPASPSRPGRRARSSRPRISRTPLSAAKTSRTRWIRFSGWVSNSGYPADGKPRCLAHS